MERIYRIDRRDFIRGLTCGVIALGFSGCTAIPAPTEPFQSTNKNLLSSSEASEKYPLTVEQTLNSYKLLGLDETALSQAFKDRNINPDHQIIQRLYETKTDSGRLGIGSKLLIAHRADKTPIGELVLDLSPVDFPIDIPPLKNASIEATTSLYGFLLYYPFLKDTPGTIVPGARDKMIKASGGLKQIVQDMLNDRMKPVFSFGYKT